MHNRGKAEKRSIKSNQENRARKIWIADNEAETCRTYRSLFEPLYSCSFFPDPHLLIGMLGQNQDHPDLVISEIKAGDQPSFKLPYPVIIVTTTHDLPTMKHCFDQGVFDYLLKPLSPPLLRLKVELALNQHQLKARSDFKTPRLEHGEITLDSIRMFIRNGGSPAVKLTPKELQIFSILYSAGGSEVPKEKIHQEIWGSSAGARKSIDVHIFNLRNKVRSCGLNITFDPKKGYHLEKEPI